MKYFGSKKKKKRPVDKERRLGQALSIPLDVLQGNVLSFHLERCIYSIKTLKFVFTAQQNEHVA